MAYFAGDNNYWEKQKPPRWPNAFNPSHPFGPEDSPRPYIPSSPFGLESETTHPVDVVKAILAKQETPRPSPPGNAGSSAAADREISDRLNPKLWDALGKIGSAAFAGGQQGADEFAANDPMAIYEQIRNATPGYAYKGPSAESMAARQFDPIFKMLAAQRTQGTGRYNTQKAAATDSYTDYVNNLTQSQNENKQAYTRSGNEIDAAGKAASGQVTAEAQKNAAGFAQILAGLGQQDSAGQLLSENQGDLTDALGTIGANQAMAKNLNSSLATSTQTHDEDTINLGRQAGLNYQGDILRDYNDLLAANDQQNLQLQGQKGEATNNYTMSIEEMLSKAAGSREEAISKQFSEFMNSLQDKRKYGLDQDRLDIDRSRLNLDATKAGIGPDGQPISGGALDPQKPSPQDAYRVLQSEASKLPPQSQAETVEALMSALRKSPQAKSVGELLAFVPEETLRKPYVSDLAYRFFSQYLGKV